MSTISSDDLAHYIAHAAEVGENGTPAITTGTLASLARELLSLRESHPIEDGEGWVLVPSEPTEAMLDAIMDPQSPFIGRRKMDKSGGEVVEQTNEDWRNTIGGEDDFRHRGDFKNEREAMQQADRLSAAWRLSNAIAAAPSNPGTKVENSRST